MSISKNPETLDSHKEWQDDFLLEIKKLAKDFLETSQDLHEQLFEIMLNLHQSINQLDETYRSTLTDKSTYYTFQSVATQYYDYIYDLENGNSIHTKSELNKNEIISKAKKEYLSFAFIENNFKPKIDHDCQTILSKIENLQNQ